MNDTPNWIDEYLDLQENYADAAAERARAQELYAARRQGLYDAKRDFSQVLEQLSKDAGRQAIEHALRRLYDGAVRDAMEKLRAEAPPWMSFEDIHKIARDSLMLRERDWDVVTFEPQNMRHVVVHLRPYSYSFEVVS